jgi:hypothetical protein
LVSTAATMAVTGVLARRLARDPGAGGEAGAAGKGSAAGEEGA